MRRALLASVTGTALMGVMVPAMADLYPGYLPRGLHRVLRVN